MYGPLRASIEEGVTDLPLTYKKITEAWINDVITYNEYTELRNLAVHNVTFPGDPAYEPRIVNLESAIETHSILINKLFDMVNELTGNSTTTNNLKDPSYLLVYSDGLIAKTDSEWIYNGGVWKAIAPDTYGLCWGPAILPQFWENVSAEYDLTKLNVEEE